MQFYLVSKLFFYLEELCDSEGLGKFIDKYGIPFSVWVWTKISNSNDESQFNFNLLLSPINKFYFWSNKTLWLLQSDPLLSLRLKSQSNHRICQVDSVNQNFHHYISHIRHQHWCCWHWCWWWLISGVVGRIIMLATLIVGDFLNVSNRSSTSQTCHQHIWSPTSVTNINLTNSWRRYFRLIHYQTHLIGSFKCWSDWISPFTYRL